MEDFFIYQTNLRRWTKGAIECYKIGCNCSKCNIPEMEYFKKKNCKMKYYVIWLNREFGKPKNEIGLNYIIEDSK